MTLGTFVGVVPPISVHDLNLLQHNDSPGTGSRGHVGITFQITFPP